MDFDKIAEETLGFNPGAEDVHVTSDGTAFLDVNAAKNHASTLADGKIRTFGREITSEGTPGETVGNREDKTKKGGKK